MPDVTNAIPALPRLPPAVPFAGVPDAARQAFRQLLGDNDRTLNAAFDRGQPVRELTRQRARLVGQLVANVWRRLLGEPGNLALFAVGGFGRERLFPASDVDLLVLVSGSLPAPQKRQLERFFACLWDIGLKPGQAVRGIRQCRQLAAKDASVFTTLLDAHRLAGAAELDQALQAIVDAEDLWPERQYLAARLADQRERHRHHGDTAHRLEPNLKDGPGGLRTLDTLRWLGRRLTGANDFAAMVTAGLLDPAELVALQMAEETLARCRYGLHLVAGHAEEHLLFDYQRELALRLGFTQPEDTGNAGIERFMQSYYRATAVVERMGLQLGESFEEMLEPAATPQPLNADFARVGQRLAPIRGRVFLERPAALVELFALALDQPDLIGLTAATMRRIHRAVARLGPKLGADAGVLAAFAALLRRGTVAVPALARMNRFGLLAAIVPGFAQVVGRMQYDLFHIYTVDEHTLHVLDNVARFATPDARKEFPLASGILPGIDRPGLLLLAALFHDIAKGRGGDHAVLGALDAHAFCLRLGFSQGDADLVAWLVREHLLMSATAQRQDITDPVVVHRFAAKVGDWERLDYLYLLTVADIIGTSPKLWNTWKDRLLSDLYTATRYELRADTNVPLQAAPRIALCQARALELLRGQGFAEAEVQQRWEEFPDQSFLRHRPEQIAWQTTQLLRAGETTPVVAVEPLSVRGTTELFVYTADRVGLFADLTATLDRQRFAVVEARVLGSRTGMAMDTFLLLDADHQQPASARRAATLREQLLHVLDHSRRIVPSRRRLPRQLRHFRMVPQVNFKDDLVASRTQVALVTTDFPGLLATVAQAFLAVGVRVHDARIATFGERVEDFFLISDSAGDVLAEADRTRLRAVLREYAGWPEEALSVP